jgi:hypothetical protein
VYYIICTIRKKEESENESKYITSTSSTILTLERKEGKGHHNSLEWAKRKTGNLA